MLTIDSYQKIKNFRYSLGYYANLAFRGTKESFLHPPIVRHNNRLTNYQLKVIEEQMHNEYVLSTGLSVNGKDEDVKARVFEREHGLFNRMMDWSSDLHIALTFATHDVPDHQHGFVYLWILNKKNVKIIQTNDASRIDYHEINEPIFLHNPITNSDPQFSRRRQLLQGGSFLILPWENVTTPVDKLLLFQNNLFCIRIPKRAALQIREEIKEDKGFDPYSDMLIDGKRNEDHIAEYLNEKYLNAGNEAL